MAARKKPAGRASAGTIREDALYEEISDLLRTMPSDWRRQYRSGRDKLAASGGPTLPSGMGAATAPSPEQAMLLIGITAGGNPSGDSPFGPHRVPAAVRQAAMKGIRLSHANNYGAWDFIGLARAIELVIVPSVSDTTFKRMGLYLFRHKKDALGSNFGNDANPSRGYMAWLNWGGDPAVPWTRAFERNPDMIPEPPPVIWLPQADVDANLTLAPRAMEALTPDALKVRGPRLPSKAIAVVSPVDIPDGQYLQVLLLDPKVLKRRNVTGSDVLGYATAQFDNWYPDAIISVAAAEKGYGYLLYATMANLAATVAEHRGVGKPSLTGSSCQTEYAERFWSRQPGGVVRPLSKADFKKQFKTTYESIVGAGDTLVKELAPQYAGHLRAARDAIFRLGSDYFGAYYRVSTFASGYLPGKLARPHSPRATVGEIFGSRKRKFNVRSLALVALPTNTDLPRTYLVHVPRGEAMLEPENILAEIVGSRKKYGPPRRVLPRGRLSLESNEPYVKTLVASLETLGFPSATVAQRQEHLVMLERGEALKEAMVAAGVPETEIPTFLDYLDLAAREYTGRATEIEREVPIFFNPRRFAPLRVFMPI